MRLPAALRVTPLGNAPDSLKVGAGEPVAVTVNVPALPTVNVVAAALVNAGAWVTVRVTFAVCWPEVAVPVTMRT